MHTGEGHAEGEVEGRKSRGDGYGRGVKVRIDLHKRIIVHKDIHNC